jgi:hypothetical protein
MDSSSKNNERIIEKFNEIQNEILRIGWKGILQVYHPDTNSEHPEAFKVFQLYKEIYENMKKRLMIDTEMINSDTANSNGSAI